MNPINTIHSNEECSNDYLISGLPNEVSLQCVPYFSCETLSTLSRVSKLWNAVTKEELFFYKCEIKWTNFNFFQSMISIWGDNDQEEMDLEHRIVQETLKDQTSFGSFSDSLYSELLEPMKKMAKLHKNTLFLFEPFPKLNRFQQYAYSHLLPLKNVICLSDANISKRLNVKSISNKIDTLILSGTICRNPIALESLKIRIPQMEKIQTLIWSGSDIDLRVDNEDNFAFEALSKVLGKIENLTSLTIHDFDFNRCASENLIILFKNFKKLNSFNLRVRSTENLITIAARDWEKENNSKYIHFSFNQKWKNDTETNELTWESRIE